VAGAAVVAGAVAVAGAAAVAGAVALAEWAALTRFVEDGGARAVITWSKRRSRKGKPLFLPLRQALTGMDHGPDMGELLPLIGETRARERLEQAAQG